MSVNEILKKYKITLLIILITFVIVFAGIVIYNVLGNKSIKIMEYKNEIYKMKYDSTWKLKEKTEDKILLSYNKDISLEIDIINLKDDYLYMSLEEILDEVEYSVKEQNPNYGLIGKQEILVTKNGYLGYQLLYENDNSEVMVMLAKKSDQLLIINYQSPYDSFDILLDSAKDIVYNFELLDIEYEITNMIDGIEFEKLSLKSDSTIKYENKKTYSFADVNALIELEIPDIFTINSFNSTAGYFYSNDNISLFAHIINVNIYELLEEIKNENSIIVYNTMEDKDAKISKINDNEYIYHIKYTVEGLFDPVIKEKVYMMHALRKDRVLFIELSGSSSNITSQLIDSITLKNYTRYAENIYKNIKNGSLINEMKYIHKDYANFRKYSIIKLYTPEKYQEFDYNNNKYDTRYFGYLYDEKTMKYNFEINYTLTSNIESTIKNIESVYKSRTKKTIDTKKYNNREFKRYYYEYKNGYSYVLFYELVDGTILQIQIDSKKKITEQDIKELTNFKIETLTMNN